MTERCVQCDDAWPTLNVGVAETFGYGFCEDCQRLYVFMRSRGVVLLYYIEVEERQVQIKRLKAAVKTIVGYYREKIGFWLWGNDQLR